MTNDANAPTIEDTIRATLRAINERNRQINLAAGSQNAGQPDYSVDRSSGYAPDDDSDPQSMNLQTAPQTFQPDVLPFALPPLHGDSTDSADDPSPEDFAQALQEYKSPPDPVKELLPYLTGSQPTLAQMFLPYRPQQASRTVMGADADSAVSAQPEDLARALFEYSPSPNPFDETRRYVNPNEAMLLPATASGDISPLSVSGPRWITNFGGMNFPAGLANVDNSLIDHTISRGPDRIPVGSSDSMMDEDGIYGGERSLNGLDSSKSTSGMLAENSNGEVDSNNVGQATIAANGPLAHPSRPNQPSSPGTDATFPVYVGDDLADEQLARDVRLAAQQIHDADPEHFPYLPSSVTFQKDLRMNPAQALLARTKGESDRIAGDTSWFGGDIHLDQDTHLSDDRKSPEDKINTFFANLTHEMGHLPQTALSKVEMNLQEQFLRDRSIHDQIDQPVPDAGARAKREFILRRQFLDAPGDYPIGRIYNAG